MPVGLLARHVIKTTATAMSAAVVILAFLQLLFNYLAELSQLTEQYNALHALQYVLWNAPLRLMDALPIGVLMGGVIGLGALAGNSELLVMRAAGVSLWRIVSWAMLPALAFVLLNFAISQWLFPFSNQHAARFKQTENDLKLGEVRGYWTREGQYFIYIDYANAAGQLKHIQLLELDKNYRIRHINTAQNGEYRQQQWQLQQVKQVSIQADGSASVQALAAAPLSLALQPKFVHMVTTDPQQLAPSELVDYMRYMRRYSQVPKKYELAFWQKVAAPFSIMALLLMACSFIFGPLRQQSMSFRIVMALFFGLGFNYIRDFFAYASLVYAPSVIWFVFLPIVLVFAVGAYLIQRAR